MDPISLLMVGVIYGCSHGVFGNSCDEDAKCWQWQNMVACHERYFGNIHTAAYLAAVKAGHNITPRVYVPAVYVGTHR